MAAVGAEAAAPWFLSSGVASVFLLLFLLFLLSIFLTGLCSECSRRSFELRDPETNKDPSSLIRVVKLEEAMVARENPMINEILSDEKDVHSSAPPDHIYQTIGGAVVSPQPTNQEPAKEHAARSAAVAGDSTDSNSVYAQVSKKWRPPGPPDHAPAALQEEEEEESSPPLPDRETQLEE